MEDPRELLRRAGDVAAGLISGVSPAQLGNPSPCTEWSVRDLINHMANGNLRVVALVSGEPGPDRGEDVLGADPASAFRDSFRRLCTAFDAEGVLERIFPTPFGDGPGSQLVVIRVIELTVHSWDLAAATGKPRDLDPVLVAFAESTLRARPIPRGGGSFGVEQPGPQEATAADRLAAYAGRKVPDL